MGGVMGLRGRGVGGGVGVMDAEQLLRLKVERVDEALV
jgi:hypothetical protein